jgi:O-antigen/teichoic acid export membrane protein
MGRVSRNLVANLVGRGWSTVLGLVLVPVYLKFLGIEAYGLVGVFITLQNLSALADFGLGMSLNREMARLSVDPDRRLEQRDTLRTFELVFWLVSVVVGLAIVAVAGWISKHWVSAHSLSPASVASAVRLMGAIVAIQLPFALYQSGLMGLQRQTLLNVIATAAGTARGAGAVLVLWLVSPTIQAFLLWQLVIAVLQTLAAAAAVWRSLPARSPAVFRPSILRRLSHFASGVALNAIVGASLTQLDKVLLSNLLSLERFGYYTLAGTVASGLWSIIAPVNAALFPRFTQLIEHGDESATADYYHRACQLMAVATLPVAAILAVFSREILAIWTRSPVTAEQTALLVSLLVLGTALNGIVSVPSYFQTAAGWPHLALYSNAVSAAVLVPAIVVLARLFGAQGAAAVWVVLNAGYILFFVPIMHRRLLRGEKWTWYREDAAAPLLAVLAVAATLRWIAPPAASPVATFAFLAAGWLALVLATLGATPRLRGFCLELFSRQVRARRERFA